MDNRKAVNEYEAAVLRYNKIAMNYLKFGNLKDSLVLLRKAEEILNMGEGVVIPNRLKLMSITLNNLGCYYKKRKQPKVALNYLEHALDIESQTEDDGLNIASSHLNICAVYSNLNNHKQALAHAKQAIGLLESSFHSEDYIYEKTITLATSLVISYYNLAVELEFLNNFVEANKYFEKALEFSKLQLGPNHPMTYNVSETLKKFENKHKRSSKSTARTIKSSINEVETGRYRLPSVTPRSRNLSVEAQSNLRMSSGFDRTLEIGFRY